MKKLFMLFAGAVMCLSAHATLLTSKINTDNAFFAYISTIDNAVGTQFSSGTDWTTTVTDTTTLAAGTDYYLHIWGIDYPDNYIYAGLLGEFSLDSASHVFSNGTGSLLTNTSDWQGNTTGFNGTYGALVGLGTNGVAPWGARTGVSGSAQWIWTSGFSDPGENNAYFTTKITAVPEGGATLLLLGIGLSGLAFVRRRTLRQG